MTDPNKSNSFDLDDFKKKSLPNNMLGYKRVIKAENTDQIASRLFHDPISGFHIRCKYLKDTALTRYLHLGSLVMVDSHASGDVMFLIYYYEHASKFHLLKLRLSTGVIKDMGELTPKQVITVLKNNKI
jgi:hypothetical protein